MEDGMGFLKKLGIKPPYDPAILLLGIYPEETKTEKIYAHQCSQQYYLQQPRYASNQNVHQEMNGKRRCEIHTHTLWNTTQSLKTKKFCHLQQHDEPEGYYAY